MSLNPMADHEMQMLPGGLVLALHFDNTSLAKTKNLTGSRSASPGLHESPIRIA